MRDFSVARSKQRSTLVVAPFALHDARIADLSSGHSLIETLRANGCSRLFLVEWKSATAKTKLRTIDSYLCDLNVAVDDIGPPVDLIGLCLGRTLLELWPREHDESAFVIDALQFPGAPANEKDRRTVETFLRWQRRTLDLPGPYFLEVFDWLFRENRIAAGRFHALGRLVDLRELRCPLFLLAGDRDSIATAGHVEKRMASYCAVAGRATRSRGQIARNDETISGRSDPCPLEHGPRNWAPISRKRSCENKDLRDAPKTKQIGTICLDRCSTSSLVFGADRFCRLEPVR